MNEVVSFGLIGCGRIAARHCEHIIKLGKLVAVCDINQARADDFASRFGGKAYYDIESFLTETNIDVVAICTPNGLHATHAIQALKAGFHVLCEKPMALSVTDCGEMIKVAERSNRRLFVIKQNRFNPPVEKVKELIDNGVLGKISSVQLNCFWNRNNAYYKDEWKGTLALDGGTLYTQFSHFIDLLYWLVGDVRNVNAYSGNFFHKDSIEFEDAGVAILEFFNGTLGTVHYTINSYQKNMEGSLTIFGEKGTLKIGGQYLNELEYQLIEGYDHISIAQGNKPNNYGTYQGSMSNHDKVYENLIDVLHNGAAIATNMFEGLKTVEIIEKIYSASKAAKR